MENNITIDLTQPLTMSFLDKNNIIHKQSFDKLRSLLEAIAENKSETGSNTEQYFSKNTNSCLAEQLFKKTVNNAIFVHGKRGAGKTTFIKSVLNYYLNGDDNKGILPIAFIDPTLIHTHQHVLVDIIVKINMAIEKNFNYCCDDKKRNQYRESLNGMSEGLKLLKNYQPNQVEDAQWFMSQALRESRHGQILEEKFHKYIDNVVELLGVKLLVIAIDDVDTETKEAYEVLEIIRSTLTHPRVCVLLTGDESLYNFIVHEKKLESLGGLNNGRSDDAFLGSKPDMAIHLTQQYLLKVLPAQQRLELKDLYSIVKGGGQKINIKYNVAKEAKTETIDDFWSQIFKHGLFLVQRETNNFVDFILQQPIRSITQMSYGLTDEEFFGHSNARKLVGVFSKVFYSELFAEGLDIEILDNNDISVNSIGKAMVELYVKYEELETGFYARPDTNHPMFNACQIVLSSLIASYSAKNTKENRESVLGNAITLMLTTGAACNILMNYVPDYHVDNKWKGYINYIGLPNKGDVYSVAAHYSPIILDSMSVGKASPALFKSGVIKTIRKSSTSMKNYLKSLSGEPDEKKYMVDIIEASGTLSNLSDVIKKILEREGVYVEAKSATANALAVIACRAAGHSVVLPRGSSDYISCYTLLAFMAELSNAQDKEWIKRVFFKRLELPTYGAPAFIKNKDITSDEEENAEDEIKADYNYEQEEGLYDNVLELLDQWRVHTCGLGFRGVSSVMQGKMWTRIFYSLSRVSEELRKRSFFGTANKRTSQKQESGVLLHEIMTINIASMINAVMIEESRFSVHSATYADKNIHEKIYNALLNAENVATTLDKFEYSLSSVNSVLKECGISANWKNTSDAIGEGVVDTKSKSEFDGMVDLKRYLPMTYSLMSCPLFIPFLIHLLHDFDDTSASKWREYSLLRETMKVMLKDTTLSEYFIKDDDWVKIDMHYISALSIAKA